MSAACDGPTRELSSFWIDQTMIDGCDAVGEDVVREHLRGQPLHARVLQVHGVHLVDRDLRPEHDPEPVGLLLEVGMQRVVAADQRRAELLGPGDELVADLVVDREAELLGVLVQADAAEVQLAAVEQQAAAGDADRADAGLERVARGAGGAA